MQEHTVLVRIISLYLAGCILLLLVFSAVLTWYLTSRTTQIVLTSSKNSVNQAYNAASFILSDAYDSYYKLYQSLPMQHSMFGTQHTVEDKLALLELFDAAEIYNSCVKSIYVVNKNLDTVYTNEGFVSSLTDFYDQQALRLFEFYNENSTTVFLPRSTTYSIYNEPSQERNYLTLIFALKNNVSTVMGGLIVNIDESRLHSLITADLENPEHMYIVSSNGSILAHSNPAKINTTLQGTPLWRALSVQPEQKESTLDIEFEGSDSLVTCKNSDKLLFSFINIVPKSQIQSTVSYIRTFVVVVFFAFLLLAFFISLFCGRYIYTPISRLVGSLKVRAGQDTAEAPMDEFLFLDKAYESLCSEVESLSSSNEVLSQSKLRECLVSLLRGEFATEERCREAVHSFTAFHDTPYYIVAVTAFDDFAALVTHNTQQDLALFKYAIFNVAGELLGSTFVLHRIDMSEKYITLLLGSHTNDGAAMQALRTALYKVNEAMTAHLHFTVSSGVGTFTDSLMHLPKSNSNAFTALGYRLVQGCQTVIAYADIALRQNFMSEYPAEDEAALLLAVRNRSADKAAAALDSFFGHISLANPDSINMSVSQLSISLSRITKALSVSKELETKFNFRTLSVMLADCDCLAQRKKLLLTLCRELIESRSHEVQSKRGELIDRIREFIESNYANPLLGVEDIAAYAELSPNYLRTTFKAATGKSPTDYLSDFRIQTACELLETTNHSTKEIAEAAGYYNHRYFYSVFKSKTGMTATEYRTAKTGAPAREEEEA